MTRARANTAGRHVVWHRYLIVVALVTLLGQTSTLLHQALVQHATCAEHGEAVHVTAPAADPAAQLTRAAAAQPGLTAATVDDGDQHEHCATAHSRASGPRLAPDRALEAVPVRTFASVCTEAGLLPAVASYLLAPKTSPPHAAS